MSKEWTEVEMVAAEAAWKRALSGREQDPVLVAVREICECARAQARKQVEQMGVSEQVRHEWCIVAGTHTDLLADLAAYVASEKPEE